MNYYNEFDPKIAAWLTIIQVRLVDSSFGQEAYGMSGKVPTPSTATCNYSMTAKPLSADGQAYGQSPEPYSLRSSRMLAEHQDLCGRTVASCYQVASLLSTLRGMQPLRQASSHEMFGHSAHCWPSGTHRYRAICCAGLVRFEKASCRYGSRAQLHDPSARASFANVPCIFQSKTGDEYEIRVNQQSIRYKSVFSCHNATTY